MKVLKIGAVWCSGCLIMGPRWRRVEAKNPWLETEYFEFDESAETIKQYLLDKEKLPVFIFLDKDGKEIDRLHGEMSERKIKKKIIEHKGK